MKMTRMFVAGCLFASSCCVASDLVTTKVKQVGQRGNGDLVLEFQNVINESGCQTNQAEIAATHPRIKDILTIAMSASVSNSKVNIKTRGCYQGAPTIDESRYSFLVLAP